MDAGGSFSARDVGRAVALLVAALLVLVAMAVRIPAVAAASPVQLLEPAEGASVEGDAGLRWGSVPGATRYRVEFSDSATFAYIYGVQETVATRLEPPDLFSNGTVHWRVSAKVAGVFEPPTAGSFEVVRTDVPSLVAPANGATFDFPTEPVRLRWTPSIAGPYEIDLSNGAETGGYISTETNYVLPQKLAEGTWTWRVRPLAAGMPWSASRTFVVTWSSADLVIAAPADGASTERPLLDWGLAQGASDYQVQVSQSSTFDGASTSTDTTTTSDLRLPLGGDGLQRWWRVRARHGQMSGPWTTPRSFVWAPWSDAPADLYPNDATYATLPTLRWSPVADAATYELQVASSVEGLDGGGVPCIVHTNGASFGSIPGGACSVLTNSAAGDRYWRVRALDYPRTPSAWSATAHFTFDPATGGQPLAAPVIATPTGPADCTDPPACALSGAPILTWEPVAHAHVYRVQIDRRAEHLPGRTFDTTSTSFIPPVDWLAEAGTAPYTWQVVACDSGAQCPDWTAPGPQLRHFVVGAPTVTVVAPDPIASHEGEAWFGYEPVVPSPAAGSPWDLTLPVRALGLEVDDEPSFDVPRLLDTGMTHAGVSAVLPMGALHWRAHLGDVVVAEGTFDQTWSAMSHQPADGTSGVAPIAVGWSPVLGAASYGLEMSRADWTPPVVSTSPAWTGSTVGEAVAPGPLGWRVTAVDGAGRTLAQATGTVEVLPISPVLHVPADGASGSTIGTVFSWVPLDAVVNYRFTASTDPGFANVIESVGTQRTRYVPTSAYPAGQFYWRVQAVSAYGQVLGSSPTRRLALAAPAPNDLTPPSGTVAIAGGASFTRTPAVTVSVPATDGGSGLAEVALSNDAVSWTTRPYSASQPWVLSGADGTKTVRIKWKDQAGNWSSVTTDAIVLDTTSPAMTAPRRGFIAGTTVTTSSQVPVRLPWTGVDAVSGIARYELAQQTDQGTWTTVSTALTAPSATRTVTAGHTYAFRVRGVDKAGNVSGWATGATFTVSRYQESSSRITYSGTWATSTGTPFLGGATKRSSLSGSKASFTFTGRSIAWIARTGPDRGKAEVYVNGTKVATVDLRSSTYQNRRAVWVGSWTTSTSRRVTIKVLGTSGRPRVDLDALFTVN